MIKNKEATSAKQTTTIDAFMDYLKKPKEKISEQNNEKEASNLARESETIQVSTATESLAKLMVAQQKYEEAIKIYQTLQLKNTTKHAYFAEKIEQLQQFIV